MAERGIKRRRRTRWNAVALIGAFMGLTGLPGLYQATHGFRRADAVRWSKTLRQEPWAVIPRQLETDLNQRFIPGDAARTLLSGIPLPALRSVSPDNVVGVNGFVFYGVDAQVTRSAGFLSPPLNHGGAAATTLAQLSRALESRGIHLLVVPVPAKSTIYPEFLDQTYDQAKGPNQNAQHAQWISLLRENQIDVLDLTDSFWRAKSEMQVYYPTDTHWSHRATRLAAQQIADRLRPVLRLDHIASYDKRWATLMRESDLAGSLPGYESPPSYSERFLELRRGNGPLIPGDDAPVLVIGDSFAALHNNEGASASQQIMDYLGADVQNAGIIGAKSQDMLRVTSGSPSLLEKKKAVVLIFTIRLLICCDWEPPKSLPKTADISHNPPAN